ncbi:MAG: hypothetical protein OEZ32_07490 [Nitrospinota bacterium]|nr:hypothetical protein [Nitrospinota bacterium]
MKRSPYLICFFISLFAALTTSPVHAYVGPGAGMGLVSSFFALAVVIAMSLFMILLYPIRALLKQYRGAKPDEESGPPPEESTDVKEEGQGPQP